MGDNAYQPEGRQLYFSRIVIIAGIITQAHTLTVDEPHNLINSQSLKSYNKFIRLSPNAILGVYDKMLVKINAKCDRQTDTISKKGPGFLNKDPKQTKKTMLVIFGIPAEETLQLHCTKCVGFWKKRSQLF